MLCKHEVVGSIPSGSTIVWDLAPQQRRRSERNVGPGYLEHSLPRQTIDEDRRVRSIVSIGEDISDIVKRECGRWGRESVYPGGHVRQAYGDWIGNDPITGLFVTVSR